MTTAPAPRRLKVILPLVVGAVLVVALLELTGRGAGRSAHGWALGSPTRPSPDARPADVMPDPMTPWSTVGGDVRAADGQPIPGRFVVTLRPSARIGGDDDAELDGAALGGVLSSPEVEFAALGGSALAPRHRRAGGQAAFADTLVIYTSGDGQALQQALAEDEDVAWFEPVYRVTTAAEPPNDPYFPYQWHLSTTGVVQAWGRSRGEGVVVAVLDTGLSPGRDGYGAQLPGYDFIDDDADTADENGHGSFVTGIIAQATDNDRGVAGAAPGVQILPVRVMDAYGHGTSEQVAAGIVWAVDQGAQVINLSVATTARPRVLRKACEYAEDNGVVVVAAVGNEEADEVGYPAGFPSVVAVGASTLNGERAWYSNTGDALDLLAPGGDLRFDDDGDGVRDGVFQELLGPNGWVYAPTEGTSYAAPQVTALAALVMGTGITEPSAVRDALFATAEDLGDAGWDPFHGYGLIDADAATAWTTGSPRPAPKPTGCGG